MRVRPHAFSPFFVLAAVASTGCRSPTQIDVVVSTDLACSQVSGTSVTTGTLGEIEKLPPASTTNHCSDGHIGSVVLVPSGDDQALVAFKVVTALNGESVDQCTPDDAGSYGDNCIVARRAIRYLSHTSLQVDVLMAGECAGKACDPTSTCVEGTCVPATIADPSQCEGSGCGEQVLAPDGGAFDATVPADSGEPIDAGGTDATITGGGDASTDAGSPGDASMIDSSSLLDSGSVSAVPGCDLGGALAGAAWPMEGYCPSHRNRSPFVGPALAPKAQWVRTFDGGNVISAPSIGPDGTLYVAVFGVGAQNAIYALSPKDGSTIWQYAPNDGEQFESMPLLAADGTLRIVDETNGTYTTLDLDGGVLRSAVPLETPGESGNPVTMRGGLTVVGGGNLYGSTTQAHLFELTPSGTFDWFIQDEVTSDFIVPTVLADGTVIVGNGPIDGFNGSTGAQIWSYDAAAPVSPSSVAVAPDGTLRVTTQQGAMLYALEPDGGFKWGVPTEQAFANILAVGDDGTTYVGAADDLVAYDSTGKQAGSYGGPCDAPIIDAEGNVYDTCSGNVVKLDPQLVQAWATTVPLNSYQSVNDSLIIGPGGALFVTADTEGSPDGGPPDMLIGLTP